MDTQRVHHTDNSYPFNRAGTNARAIVNCSLKNRRTRVESNKPGAKRASRERDPDRVRLTASNRVVSACHFRTNTDLAAVAHANPVTDSHIAYAVRMFFAWRYCVEQSHLLLYTRDPGMLRIR
jgi:hypothetical protein